MKFIEDRLEVLDRYFEGKKDSEKWIIIIGIAFVIGYLSYALLLPITEEKYKKSVREKQRVEKSIRENETYLRSITVNGDRDYYVKQLTRQAIEKEDRIKTYQKKISFVDASVSQLSDMLFNQRSWSNFIDSITEKAALHNVEIRSIKSRYVDSNKSFGHVLEVGIRCTGKYKGIVKFMNELEQNVLVTDIYGTNIGLDRNSSTITSDINVSVWGVNH